MVPRLPWRSAHSLDVNVTLLYELAREGMPKCDTHPSKNAAAQWAEFAIGIGIAVRYLLVLSITVSKYLCPLLGGKGPTTSSTTSENLGASTGKLFSGGMIILCGFACKHAVQCVTYSEICFFICGQ